MPKNYVAVKSLIVRNNRILIIKRNSNEDFFANEWDLPGGKVLFGENPLNALKREVKEECRLEIKPIKPIDVWTFFKNNKQTQVIGITFLSKIISGKLKLGDEHSDYKWIRITEVKNYKIHHGIKETIKKFKE